MDEAEVEIHDVIQVTDKDHRWFASLLIVAEIRPNEKGVWAYRPRPGRAPAFLNLTYDQFVIVGQALVVAHEFDVETEEEPDDTAPPRSALN